LLPKEAINRANIRFAIEFFGSKLSPSLYKFALNSKDVGAFDLFKETLNAGFKRVS
jgi:hypothetical protein